MNCEGEGHSISDLNRDSDNCKRADAIMVADFDTHELSLLSRS
jgi:hypothetical protein